MATSRKNTKSFKPLNLERNNNVRQQCISIFLIFLMLLFADSSYGQDYDSSKCDGLIILTASESVGKVSEDLMLKFLKKPVLILLL